MEWLLFVAVSAGVDGEATVTHTDGLWRIAQLIAQLATVQGAAEALRIVDFNERRQAFFCRACRYRDPLGPDGNKLHDDRCPWVEYVRAFKQLLDQATELEALVGRGGLDTSQLSEKKDEDDTRVAPLRAGADGANIETTYAADRAELMLAADGSMMCEQHPGYEWGRCPGGTGCAGPGMPWVLSGRTLIEEVIAGFCAQCKDGLPRGLRNESHRD